jgi:hypothetical protein
MPLSLTDAQLATVTDIAQAHVQPHMRSKYLERVAELLHGHDLGDGIVARMARQAANETRKARSGRLASALFARAG